MLRSIRDVLTCNMSCPDGELGKVEKVYFDVRSWRLRYLMVDISVWKYGKKIAVPPGCIHQIDFASSDIKLSVALKLMVDSVPIDMEEALCPSLMSTVQALGYTIEAAEGPIGRIRDFLFDDQSWMIKYLNVDTHEWWQSESDVLLPTESIVSLDSANATISTSLSRDALERSPVYGDQVPI